ncbi:MAG: S-adenosylmethionine:tRNA ribosyltransferase-isomerase, partial [Oscillospiraceae bacterium]|nr:S-adenosylmethionine:tRNA ribosyltransferase-isomerase [Oscillospiraceae bacterium]
MKKNDFYYDLPPELIAQTPIPERDHSRLLCLDRENGALTHRMFYELPSLLREGDCLVINDSRVLPARLLGHRTSGGAAELVLL